MDKVTTSDSGDRYAALDGLRVFSALAVIVYHVSMVGQYEVGGVLVRLSCFHFGKLYFYLW